MAAAAILNFGKMSENSIASIWTSHRFIKMAAAAAQYYFRFRICWYRCLQKVKKSISKPNFVNWWLRYNYFRFWKTNVHHYWKSTVGFNFDHFPEICTLFCIRLPNFVQIAEIWRHIHFSRCRPRRLNTTSGFVSVDVTAFRRLKSISKPNFVEISQMEAEIYFYSNPKWLGKGSIFFKIKNVSISWDALLHFMNTKMYFWCL